MRLTLPIYLRTPYLSRVRKSRAKRAFQSVLIGCFVFIVATVSFGIWAEPKDWFRDPIYGDKQKRVQALVANNPQPLVVFFGSSRVAYGFDAGRAETKLPGRIHAFNAAVPGAGPFAERIYFKRLLEANVEPKLVFIEILPKLLHDDASGPAERGWTKTQYLTHRERKELVAFGWPEWPTTSTSALAAWSDYRLPILARTIPFLIPTKSAMDWAGTNDSHGWSPFSEETFPRERMQKAVTVARQEYEQDLKTLNPGGSALEAIRFILADCRTRGIAVRLVLMPESSTFRSWYGAGVNEKLMHVLRTLDAPIVDAREWISDTDFLDGHHLLLAGAKAFTERLTRDVIVPWREDLSP